MFHDPDRQAMRRRFAHAWQRVRAGQPASDLDRQIAAVVAAHPEYHALLADEDGLDRDFPPEAGQVNPFLHLSLHLAIRDQLATDRPAGIRAVFATLCETLADEHAAEHRLLERLGEALWQAQRDGRPPDEAAYLEALRQDAQRA